MDFLDDLCVDWGFCIDPASLKRLICSDYINADEFACSILKAEGMNAEVEIGWRRKIRNRFIEKFGKEISKDDFKNSL